MRRSSSSYPRCLLLGDIAGKSHYHVGDEAMLGVLLSRLRESVPNISNVVVSRDIDYSSHHYKCDAVPLFGFAGIDDEVARRGFLEKILLGAEALSLQQALPDSSPGAALLRAIADSDAVLVTGGGNLSSSWPEHLYERAALLLSASRLGRPSAVVSQTLGPELRWDHEALVKEALSTCRWIGFREEESFLQARELGLPENLLHQQLDDALVVNPELLIGAPESSWIAVSVHPYADPRENPQLFAPLGLALDKLAAQTDSEIVFVPHVNFPDHSGEIPDSIVGAFCRDQSADPNRWKILEVMEFGDVISLTAGADLVVSTRYHPLVFGLGGGVPGLGLTVDEYTRRKLQGVLATAGLASWTMPLSLGLSGLLSPALNEIWARRSDLRKQIQSRQTLWRVWQEDQLLDLTQTLGFSVQDDRSEVPPIEMDRDFNPRESWFSLAEKFDAELVHYWRTARNAARYAHSLENRIEFEKSLMADAQRQAVDSQRQAMEAQRDLENLRSSLSWRLTKFLRFASRKG